MVSYMMINLIVKYIHLFTMKKKWYTLLIYNKSKKKLLHLFEFLLPF
jgi:hypothetical protein